MPRYGPISYQVDFAAKGKQIGYLSLDHSDDANAYGVIPIPIAVIANGDGPTVLLTAGNHGNEYEGQVALRTLVREVEANDVHGRIIVLPSMKYARCASGCAGVYSRRRKLEPSISGRGVLGSDSRHRGFSQ